MNKTIGLLLLVFLALAAIPDTQDEIHWQWISHKDDTASYGEYLNKWPDGRHATKAQLLYDEYGWADAEATNTAQSYERYAQFHREGKHLAEARDNIESLSWQEANNANTIRSYRSYATAYPQGQYAQQAGANLYALRTDNTPFVAAWKVGTENAFKQFLEDFPGHKKTSQVRQALIDTTEGRDIVDLLHEKKIEVEAKGSGIDKVRLRIRRLVPYPLTVRIPVGTFFVSANPAAQNMVSTAVSKIALTSNDWRSVSPDAACANRPRDIPGGDDGFMVQRSPQQAELARLMPVLDEARVDTETRQAAVWIVTDNASYSDLGILVASQFGIGGSRVINEQETATAMKICTEAGIDLTKKAIWRDRQRIISGLKNLELKTWLETK